MEKREVAKRLGALIQRLRLERGHSQESFSQVCKLERTHIGKIERGEVNVTVYTTLQITVGLDMTISEFFALLQHEIESSH